MLRRHPILTLLLLLLIPAGILLANLLYTFDLNRYRDELERALNSVLSQPVHLGEAHLSLSHGLAFDFADLRIGGEGETGVLHAEHLFLKLEVWPLFRRQIVIAEILVDGPRLALTLTERKPAPDLLIDQRFLDTTVVRSFRVRNGEITFTDRRRPERPLTLTLADLTTRITDLALNHPGEILASGKLHGEGFSSPFTLHAKLALPPAPTLWRQTSLHLALTLRQFAPEPLLEHYIPNLPEGEIAGTCSVDLNLGGSPADGLRFEGTLTGKNLALQFPDLYRTPVPLQQLSLAGTWTAREQRHLFRGLRLQADALALEGAFDLYRRQDRLWLEGNLNSGPLPLAHLVRILPDRKLAAAGTWLREKVAGGSLRLDSFRLAGPAANLLRAEEFPLQEADLTLTGGELRLEPTPLRPISASVLFRDGTLFLSDGTAIFQDSTFRFSGQVLRPLAPSRTMELTVSGRLPAVALSPLIPENLRSRLTLSGHTDLALTLQGAPATPQLDLRADLQEFACRLQQGFVKPIGMAGDLFLTGAVTPERFELEHARLHVPPLEARARGYLERGGRKAFRLAADVDPLDLKKAQPYSPALNRLQIWGAAGIHYELEGIDGRIRQRQGVLSLRDIGLHVPGPVADLQRVNGEILLYADRARIRDLAARLGASSVQIHGSLENFAAPRLELQVQASTIRARDLIFPSEQASLHDLDARLLIEKDRIRFDQVDARLEQGTEFVLRGTVENFQAPMVNLDIDARRANIDEVIALWQRPAPVKEHPPKRGKTSLFISARAEEGTLGKFSFQDAEGEITYEQGVLSIYPLHFHSGPGYAVAQVLVEGETDKPSLLKTSGHLENFDAAALHLELLERRGLVTGTLRGDFYLEGRVGKDFLPTSLGGFNVEIKDGVLRKFKGLAKVFSLLNVSQILTFKLPDMAREGMPFNRLTTTFSLNRGILSTNDLFVDSNAMNLSLVGDIDLVGEKMDLILGVKPLRTVDKIVSRIPLAGWLLTGKEKALITAHFEIRGKAEDPEVTPIPVTSISEQVLGIFKRTLGLPGKVITDVGRLLENERKP